MASTAHNTNNPANSNPKPVVSETTIRARFAHAAVAEQVRAEGLDIAKALYMAAESFNSAYFNGALLNCLVELTPPGSMNALADYRARSPEGLESCIRISTRVAAGGLRYALDVLLHEMVHAYCHEVLEDLEPGYAGHGPKWTAQCNRIGRMLELPEVYTKGRGGPNSARWPLSVRPTGYYGFEESKPGKPWSGPKKTTTKPAAPVDPLKAVRDALCQKIRSASPDVLELVAVVFAELDGKS